MAVPTIYKKLIDQHEAQMGAFEEKAQADKHARMIRNKLKKLRLMVCGSAALPASLYEKWEDISGHRLLERFGMTELGMALTNPYDP
jgi:malonyl-CoA/methylmalonyl-CoA synthetase